MFAIPRQSSRLADSTAATAVYSLLYAIAFVDVAAFFFFFFFRHFRCALSRLLLSVLPLTHM